MTRYQRMKLMYATAEEVAEALQKAAIANAADYDKCLGLLMAANIAAEVVRRKGRGKDARP